MPITARPAAVHTVSYIPIYLNLPREMKDKIPGWLWKKKAENSASKTRCTAPQSVELFKGEAVDTGFILFDLIKRGFKPIHMHLMVREHGGVRIRMMMSDELSIPGIGQCQQLPEREFLWFSCMLYGYVWDTMAHHNAETAHLPEVISVSCVNPKQVGGVMSVLEVRMEKGELVLVADPDKGVKS